MSDTLRLYGDFHIVARDSDGETVQEREITNAGTVTIEEIQQNAILHGVDELEVIPIGFETRKGGHREIRVEADRESVQDD